MSYYFSTILNTTYEEAIDMATEALQKEGFGVVTTIDIKEKLKEKLGVDFRRYIILGACSPAHAYKALLAEDKVGTMLPCNVIVQETEDNKIEVAAVNPIESMKAIDNPGLGEVALDVQARLKRVIASL